MSGTVAARQWPPAYGTHAAETNGKDYIGSLSTGDLTVLQACNKIIHASEIRAVYEDIDRQIAHDEHGQELDQKVWYLTGEIEKGGTERGAPWKAVLHVPEFIEIVMDRIAFGYPDADDEAVSCRGFGSEVC